MSTSNLDALLTGSPEVREAILHVLQTLETGGGVVTDNIKNIERKRQLEAALREYDAVQVGGFWK